MHRRDVLRTLGCAGLATLAWPRLTLAQVASPNRFVFVLLRGGVDGLAAVVPYGDDAYTSVRGAMAYDEASLSTLDDTFGFAPGLAPLRTLWDANELAVLHAVAIPYRTRSHFDGQAVLETGLDRPVGSSDGWLNRVLQVMSGSRSGIAVAAGMPLSLAGPFQVDSWSPTQLGAVDDPFLDRLAYLYRADPRLANRFEAAVQQRDLIGEEPMAGGSARRGGITPIMQAAAKILSQERGPNVAAMEFSGWDTHANQGMAGGALDRLLGQLAEGLLAFRTGMGATWTRTTVVVLTEFGRTARPNGTRGTDHGTAGAGLVISAKVGRSRVGRLAGPGNLGALRRARREADARYPSRAPRRAGWLVRSLRCTARAGVSRRRGCWPGQRPSDVAASAVARPTVPARAGAGRRLPDPSARR